MNSECGFNCEGGYDYDFSGDFSEEYRLEHRIDNAFTNNYINTVRVAKRLVDLPHYHMLKGTGISIMDEQTFYDMVEAGDD